MRCVIIGILGMLVVAGSLTASAKVLHVPGDYPTIQGAIDAASAGDVIFVDGSKSYTENLKISKSVELRCCGESKCRLFPKDSKYPAVMIYANNVTMEGFYISGTDIASIIVFDSRDVLFKNNEIFGGNGAGVVLLNTERVTIADCEIKYVKYWGIYLLASRNAMIINNEIEDCEKGICIDHSDYNVFTGNSLSYLDSKAISVETSNYNEFVNNYIGLNQGNGVCLSNSNNNTIVNNEINSNAVGISLTDSYYNTITQNEISYNKYGIWLYFAKDNRIYLNDIVYNTNQLGGLPYYKNLWHTPYRVNYTYEGRHYTNYLGNYWADYSIVDSNNDGIRDKPHTEMFMLYTNFEQFKDEYALVKPTQAYKIY